MTNRARRGIWRPKNTKDHAAFRTKCNPKSRSTYFFPFLLGALATNAAAMPIHTYKMVHTGPNTKFGGVQAGRFNVAYHVVTPSKEKYAPTAPAIKDIAIQNTYGETVFFLIYSFYRIVPHIPWG